VFSKVVDKIELDKVRELALRSRIGFVYCTAYVII
jgi:hypothetical protein